MGCVRDFQVSLKLPSIDLIGDPVIILESPKGRGQGSITYLFGTMLFVLQESSVSKVLVSSFFMDLKCQKSTAECKY